MPDASTRTGLVLLTPDVDPLVDQWRRRYDPSRARGMPAHVTILYPWLRYETITSNDRSALAELCVRRPPFDITFSRFGRFPHTLWLEPQPAEPILQLVGELAERWPDHPPYSGEIPVVVMHLTLADGHDAGALHAVVADIEPHLPVRVTVPALALMRVRSGRWVVDSEYPFAGQD
jgi:2'-5' RNA ligase